VREERKGYLGWRGGERKVQLGGRDVGRELNFHHQRRGKILLDRQLLQPTLLDLLDQPRHDHLGNEDRSLLDRL